MSSSLSPQLLPATFLGASQENPAQDCEEGCPRCPCSLHPCGAVTFWATCWQPLCPRGISAGEGQNQPVPEQETFLWAGRTSPGPCISQGKPAESFSAAYRLHFSCLLSLCPAQEKPKYFQNEQELIAGNPASSVLQPPISPLIARETNRSDRRRSQLRTCSAASTAC